MTSYLPFFCAIVAVAVSEAVNLGRNLVGANLAGANLDGADLVDTDFTGQEKK